MTLKRSIAGILALLVAVSLLPLGTAGAEEAPVPGADAPVSPTDASTRAGLEGYRIAPGEQDGALEPYSLGASRVTFASIISYAERYIGLPYVWGGKDVARDGGFDCSGYAIWVFNNVCGTALDADGTNAARLYDFCTPVSRGEAVPGDLVFFKGTYGGLDYISHVGIYCGDGIMINAGNPIGYDHIDQVRNTRGERAEQLFGRLVDLGQRGIDLAGPGVAVRVSNQPYTGRALQPAVTVTALGSVLREGVDYTLSFANNTNVGAATVEVIGRGSCAGSRRVASFEIYEAPAFVGAHTMHLASSSGMVLDMPAGSMSEGARVQLYESNGTEAQSFLLEQQPSGKYAFRNARSGLYLSAVGDVRTIGNDARVEQRRWSADASQLWDVRPLSGGALAITSALDGTLALDVQHASMRNGARIQLYRFNGGVPQQWAFDAFVGMQESLDALAREHRFALEDGIYVVRSAAGAGFALDCQYGGTDNGTRIQLYEANGTEAQAFAVSHDETGYVTLTNVKSARALDVPWGQASAGAGMHIYDANGTAAQKWVAVPSGAGMRLVSALDRNIVLDLWAADARNGATIQLYPSNGTAAQQWSFDRIG